MSVEDFKARQRDRKARTCRHFTGLPLGARDLGACAAGHRYETAVDPKVREVDRFVCLGRADTTLCPGYQRPTPEELVADEAADEAMFAEVSRRFERGECIHCGAKIARSVKVGRCLYAEPCGHRQGQVGR